MTDKCSFPDHHGGSGGGFGFVLALVGAAVITAGVLLAQVLLAYWLIFASGAAALVAGRLVVLLVATARAGRKAWRNLHRAVWAQLRWRWLARNLELAYIDKAHRRKLRPRLPFSTAVHVHETARHLLRYPRARIRPDAFGFVATVRTIPRVGRKEIEAHAQHLSDAWSVARVSVSQPKPGRVLVRALRHDPLLEPLGDVPGPRSPFEPFFGVDEWGTHRWLNLSGITGIVVTGNPGYGKTSLVLSLLDQLAPSIGVQFVFVDLKGGSDYADYEQRAWITTGDDLPDAADAVSDVHGLMRKRLAKIGDGGGPRNRWHVGPVEGWPLIVTVIDECHGGFDLEAVKGDKQAEAHVRTIRSLTGQLIKKGRSPLFLTILLTQKGTSDAVPTALRDVCGLGISFATKTVDAAVASLGESIRQYPTVCPTTLQDRPDYVGCCTASLRTGRDPFVRLRAPEVTEAAAAARAQETAHLRRDPTIAAEPAEVRETGVAEVCVGDYTNPQSEDVPTGVFTVQ